MVRVRRYPMKEQVLLDRIAALEKRIEELEKRPISHFTTIYQYPQVSIPSVWTCPGPNTNPWWFPITCGGGGNTSQPIEARWTFL